MHKYLLYKLTPPPRPCALLFAILQFSTVSDAHPQTFIPPPSSVVFPPVIKPLFVPDESIIFNGVRSTIITEPPFIDFVRFLSILCPFKSSVI